MVNPQLIDLYMEGDSIGSAYEGKEMFCEPKEPRRAVRTTDETETVRCWLEFEKSGQEINPLNWARFFASNAAPRCGWGKTYPDFFRLVKYLDKRGTLTLVKLAEMSEDRNSMGNGCLALVYPLYCSLRRTTDDMVVIHSTITEYTALTHSHPEALMACIVHSR